MLWLRERFQDDSCGGSPLRFAFPSDLLANSLTSLSTKLQSFTLVAAYSRFSNSATSSSG